MRRTIALIISLLLIIALNAQINDELSRKEKRTFRKIEMADKVDSIISTRDFIFNARSVDPLGWSTIHLSSIYTLNIIGDSVDVYLPYFGRAFQANYLSTEGGIKLREPIMNYEVVKIKNSFEIEFEVKSITDLYKFSLSVNPSGYASLSIISMNRQVINFNGIINGLGL